MANPTPPGQGPNQPNQNHPPTGQGPPMPPQAPHGQPQGGWPMSWPPQPPPVRAALDPDCLDGGRSLLNDFPGEQVPQMHGPYLPPPFAGHAQPPPIRPQPPLYYPVQPATRPAPASNNQQQQQPAQHGQNQNPGQSQGASKEGTSSGPGTNATQESRDSNQGDGDQSVPSPQTTVYVGKINEKVADETIRELLDACGSVKSWRRVKDPNSGNPKRFGFCEFEDAEGVLRAMRMLCGLELHGERLTLNVNQATQRYLEYYQAYLRNQSSEDAKHSEQDERTWGFVTAIKERVGGGSEPSKTADSSLAALAGGGGGGSEQDAAGDKGGKDSEHAGEEAKDAVDSESEEKAKEQKRREAERRFKQRERQWESHEKEMERLREKEKEREEEAKRQRRKDLQRDLDPSRQRRRSASEREHRKRKRAKEAKDDEEDARKETEELHGRQEGGSTGAEEDEQVTKGEKEEEKRSVKIGLGLKRKAAKVQGRFADEQEEEVGRERSRLQSLPMSSSKAEQDVIRASAPQTDKAEGDQQADVERPKWKDLIDRIPTRKEDVYDYDVDWDAFERGEGQERVEKWLRKKVEELLGEQDEEMVRFVADKISSRCSPRHIDEEMRPILEEETDQFVIKLWRTVIFESMKATLGQ